MTIRSTLVSRAAVVSVGVAMSCTALTTLAQWTSDPFNPVIVQGDTSDQGVPLMGAAPDGRTWVFYVDNFAAGGGGYKHALQLMNADGTHAFTDAVVVSPNRTNSATFTVDLDVSVDGSAVMAYDNNGIYVQKVDLDGTQLWDDTVDGNLIPNSTGALGPQVVATADGGAVVCWGSSATLNFQHVNADGSMGAAWQFTETGRAQSPSDMIRSGDDFILLWIRGETTSFLARKGLKIQRWTTAGTQVWNGGVPMDVYTSQATPGKSIQNGYFPRLVPDTTGGAIVAWYDNGAARNAWLQHVLPMGVFRFAPEGLAVSTATSATEYRLSAAVSYKLPEDLYTVAYERSNPLQSQYDLTAQRINGTAQLLWGGGQGVQLTPTTGNHSSFVNVNPVGEDAIVTWLQYSGANGPMSVQSARLDASGTQVWATSPLIVAADYGSKSRLQTVLSSGGDFVVASWADGTAGNYDVMANRINFDGTIGQGGPSCPACAADYDNNGGVDGGDLAAFFGDFEAGEACADVDGNGGVDGGDLGFFFTVFEAGGC